MGSTQRTLFASMVTMIVLAGSLVACGNGGANGSNTSGGNGVSNSQPGGGATSNLQVSGAVIITLTDSLDCTTATLGYTGVLSQDIDGKTYGLTISVPGYSKPGTYMTNTTDDTSLTFSDQPTDGDWESQYAQSPTTIVINADGVSGTVSGPLATGDGSSTVMISGSWHCSQSSLSTGG